MATFSVKGDDLVELARRVKAVHDAIAATNHEVPSEGDTGHHDLTKALHSFAGNWSWARTDLLKNLETMGGALVLATQDYDSCEQAIAAYAASAGG